MKKIFYIILSLSLCTAGIGTAAHFSPSALDLTAVNDTIDPADSDTLDEEDEDEYDDEEDEEENEDEFGDYTPEGEDEFGEMLSDNDTITVVNDEETAVNDTISDSELPEGMLIDVDQEMKEWNAQQYLSTDSTIVVTDKGLMTDEEYIARLRRIPAVMEMPYNDVVRQYIEKYTTRLRRSVSYMLGAQNFYIPIFEDALEAESLPLELRYLPIIESALDPTATSRVGAAGLWQFMPSTAKSLGLETNSLVDERRDVIKSSQAAAKYFKQLYSRFGDWTLVIAAYNCGPTNVQKAIERAGGSTDYWQIYPYLPRETRGYVPAFIAANYAMYYYCEHGIIPMQAKLPLESDTVVVSRDLHFQQVVDLCGVDMDQVKALNPQYRRDIVPGYWKPCAIRLPMDAVSKFIQWGDSIYNYKASELLPRRSVAAVNDTYVPAVQRTQTRSYDRSRSDYRSSKSYSSSKSKNSRNSKNSKNSKSKSKSKKERTSNVTIKKGDTLESIARRNGTTVAKLKKINGIKGDNIREGKKLKVK